jgi:hypothetical protein
VDSHDEGVYNPDKSAVRSRISLDQPFFSEGGTLCVGGDPMTRPVVEPSSLCSRNLCLKVLWWAGQILKSNKSSEIRQGGCETSTSYFSSIY